jgi:hypothetical protein
VNSCVVNLQAVFERGGEKSGQNEVISRMWRVANKSKCAPRNLENSFTVGEECNLMVE